jgi:hypothetical protein
LPASSVIPAPRMLFRVTAATYPTLTRRMDQPWSACWPTDYRPGPLWCRWENSATDARDIQVRGTSSGTNRIYVPADEVAPYRSPSRGAFTAHGSEQRQPSIASHGHPVTGHQRKTFCRAATAIRAADPSRHLADERQQAGLPARALDSLTLNPSI